MAGNGQREVRWMDGRGRLSGFYGRSTWSGRQCVARVCVNGSVGARP